MELVEVGCRSQNSSGEQFHWMPIGGARTRKVLGPWDGGNEPNSDANLCMRNTVPTLPNYLTQVHTLAGLVTSLPSSHIAGLEEKPSNHLTQQPRYLYR